MKKKTAKPLLCDKEVDAMCGLRVGVVLVNRGVDSGL